MNSAFKEVQEFCDEHSWLQAIYSFVKAWDQKTLESWKGQVASKIEVCSTVDRNLIVDRKVACSLVFAYFLLTFSYVLTDYLFFIIFFISGGLLKLPKLYFRKSNSYEMFACEYVGKNLSVSHCFSAPLPN